VRYSGEYKVKRFSCLDQYLCMAFAQLTYRESLRDIEACLRVQTVEVDGRTETVVAERLSDAEKAALWPRLVAVVPQFDVYVTRTDRDIKVFRLRPQ
jgi:hypothetical protein